MQTSQGGNDSDVIIEPKINELSMKSTTKCFMALVVASHVRTCADASAEAKRNHSSAFTLGPGCC